MTLDINCDLGENERASRTRALMAHIHSANIACGGHAGTAHSMKRCVKLAIEAGVRIGAHPGFSSTKDFGREVRKVKADDLELLLLQQVGSLLAITDAQGGRLHHIKLHGALYHAVESSMRLARVFAQTVSQYWPGARIYALARGNVLSAAKQAGVEAWSEAFAERGYLDSGRLVPRERPGALITDPRAVGERIRRLLMYGEILSISGRPVKLAVETICVHSDTPGSLGIARVLKENLDGRSGGQASRPSEALKRLSD